MPRCTLRRWAIPCPRPRLRTGRAAALLLLNPLPRPPAHHPEPAAQLTTRCVRPLPKVRSPTSSAPASSRSAPASSSEVDAE